MPKRVRKSPPVEVGMKVLKDGFDEELLEHLVKVFKEFQGDLPQLEGALGAFFMGKLMGWRVLHLIHSPKTMRTYQKLLQLDFKEHMPEIGKYADKSNAYFYLESMKDFWKVAKGEMPGRSLEVQEV